jgi:hypothetical protein
LQSRAHSLYDLCSGKVVQAFGFHELYYCIYDFRMVY